MPDVEPFLGAMIRHRGEEESLKASQRLLTQTIDTFVVEARHALADIAERVVQNFAVFEQATPATSTTADMTSLREKVVTLDRLASELRTAGAKPLG